MGGTGRKRRGGEDCAKRKKLETEKEEEKKRREKMCIEVFSFSNGSSLPTPSLQLTSLPTTSLHEKEEEKKVAPGWAHQA